MKILDLYITKICNLHCDYCYVDLISEESLSTQDIINKRINLLEYDHIKFFGGEPLMKWDLLCDIIDTVRQKKPEMLFTIITNGIFMTPQRSKYIEENNIFCVISFHLKAKKILLPVLEKLTPPSNIAISFIFETKDITSPVLFLHVLYNLGYRKFIFSPQIYDDWSEQSILLLKEQIEAVKNFLMIFPDVILEGIEYDTLPLYEENCHKTIADGNGNIYACNRFISLKKNKKITYKEAYDVFDRSISIRSNPDRWWFVCLIGWYFDIYEASGGERERMKQKIESYQNLNHIFIGLYRSYVHGRGKLSFLSPDIAHIRFNLTNQCNLRCNYCYLDFNNNVLDPKVGRNIIDFLLAQKGEKKEISFFGGEPLLCFDTIVELVEYATEKAKIWKKQVSYNIATNFLLVSEEKMLFLEKYNFNIHISWNGLPEIHNSTRDNSFSLLKRNLDLYVKNPTQITILLGFGPEQVSSIFASTEFIRKLGFTQIKFEIFLGDHFIWTKQHFYEITKQIHFVSQKTLKIKSFHEQSGKTLDISTDGKCSPSSINFHKQETNYQPKYFFDKVIEKYATI